MAVIPIILWDTRDFTLVDASRHVGEEMAVIKHSSSGQDDLEGDVINLEASSDGIFWRSIVTQLAQS